MSLVVVKGLRKMYRRGRSELHILKGVDLTVEPGESVAVVGASGAGKSTLLHIIGALDRPDAGEILIAGRRVADMGWAEASQLRASAVGFVFQSYNLMVEMDVCENVMLAGMAAADAPSRPRLAERAVELLAAVGLCERMHHTPLELSGGEQQRVAIARALMNDPRVILADEPTGNLDEANAKHVLDMLFRLAHERKRSLIMVTHSERTASACDRVFRLTDGLLVPLERQSHV